MGLIASILTCEVGRPPCTSPKLQRWWRRQNPAGQPAGISRFKFFSSSLYTLARLITDPQTTSSNTLSKKQKQKTTSDMTHDMWHMTRDTWHGHMTCDTWWGVNILSKFQLPSSYGLGKTVFWKYFHKGSLPRSVTELMTKVFVEQPCIHGSVKYN